MEEIGEALIIVNDSTTHQDMLINYTATGQWLFISNIINDSSNDLMTEKIRKYFTLFDRLDLKSRVYVLAERENHIFLFEVYKSHFNANLTVTQLCKMDRVSNTIEYLNPDIIWGRRKKLNGLTLKVGLMEDNILKYDENKVITSELFVFHLKLLEV